MTEPESYLSKPNPVEVLIIGGGPAGISCALELQDSKVSHLVLERNQRLGGQLAYMTCAIPNFAGGRFEDGMAMLNSLEESAAAANINVLRNHEIVDVDLEKRMVWATNASQKVCFTAEAIFIATGYRVKRLNIKGLEKFERFVSYRTGLIEEEFEGKDLVVAGGGDAALLEALERARTARHVTLVHRSDNYRARPDLVQEVREDDRITLLSNYVIEELSGNGSLSEITLRSNTDGSTKKVPADRLVIKVGYAPNTELFKGQLEMDESGHIKIDSLCSTSIAGVFAGGDIASPGYDRIAVAMGHGVMAAGSIRKYLNAHSNNNVIERKLQKVSHGI